MTILSLNIEVYSDWKEPLTPKTAVNDTYEIAKQIDVLFGYSKTWYLSGDTLEAALTRVAFDKQGITKDAINEFEEGYTEDYPMVISGVWDGKNNTDGCAIFYHNYRMNQLGQTKIEINISIKEKEFQFLKLIDFIKFLVSSHNTPSIMIENGKYSLKRKQVFSDRISAGWMLYLPIENDPTLASMAEEIISIPDKENNIGTLIITTKDIFDIENKEHINKANDIEICLRDLRLLPLISEV
ncbi:immunity 52 family protein [Xenorhabdus bovienii]|uniref:Imm52 family immunity protein n=1 Tax=Xenorhabdus bovienii TaxID=40576 RepID=UPI00237CED1E|nr:Imm52 family immunity protein [Xenorhabdus bovienii]MDE1486978.1 immunity 52 family protein [Xenorhabdus bovienii]MDE1495634.1 immunity 52 family protein [Xenorhabdus bovienii]MDE9477820.1 immunity 52 family protein [Xenorhabdus bovienii]MDE9530648.1 immunity 52 family protein [Xenorhabdus bovienii]